MSTKQKIIDEALTLFSIKGFTAVTVDEIAKAVGIKAPSLYKHYKSKQCIFNAIIEEMQGRYLQQMEQLHMNGVNPNIDSPFFENISEDQLLQIGQVLFSYFLHDEYNKRFRKMLVLEQFNNETLNNIYIQQYFDNPISFQETIFSSLISKKLIKMYDTKIIAIHFYAPINFLITICDAQPDREIEAFALLEKHIKQFNRIYRIGGQDNE